jgi:hypothetical protein
MAVRDEQPLEETRRGLPWREALSQAPAVLLAGGLLIYGYLSICYETFYGSLGVDPNDVGLSYTGTLARSSGFVVICLVVFGYFALQIPYTRMRTRLARRKDPTANWPRSRVVVSVVGTVFVLAMVFSIPLQLAGDAAREVQAGDPVGPVRIVVPVLAIHADPVTVEPAGKPGDSPAAQRLQGKKLLYLGQSGGTVLLYDAIAQSAIYVPASSIVLHVANCRDTPPPLPACQTAWSFGSRPELAEAPSVGPHANRWGSLGAGG